MNSSLPQPPYIPHTSGVYVFLKQKTPLYIGKAADLKRRLVSYWRKNAGEKVRRLLTDATTLEWIQTESEIDALLKEAELIKQYVPKYNIAMRDDKNYFYAGITKEEFPRIFLTHQPNTRIKNQNSPPRRIHGCYPSKAKQLAFNSRIKNVKKTHNSKFLIQDSIYVGPFTSGIALKTALRLLRKVFPYCTCKIKHKRPCLNAEIERCPGYCCILNSGLHIKVKNQNGYRKNIKNIIAILCGKRKRLLTELKLEMRDTAKKQEFERATQLRDQIAGIENIFQHKIIMSETKNFKTTWSKIRKDIQNILNTIKNISRVEGYDISNISGTKATGSMAVFIDGMPAKSEYRKFRIKTVHQPSDVDMLKEVIRRRIRHTEWQFPDLMLIDGGKPQLNAVNSIIRNRIPLAALAKKEEELYIKNRVLPIRLSILPQSTAFFFQRVRDESHRFAKKYHHKLREISLRNS